MSEKVLINDYPIQTEQLHVDSDGGEEGKRRVRLMFKVTHQDYHDITTLLYKNDFIVEMPTYRLQFPAVIQTYSTSIDNLYEEGAVGTFQLDLVEKG